MSKLSLKFGQVIQVLIKRDTQTPSKSNICQTLDNRRCYSNMWLSPSLHPPVRPSHVTNPYSKRMVRVMRICRTSAWNITVPMNRLEFEKSIEMIVKISANIAVAVKIITGTCRDFAGWGKSNSSRSL